MSFWAVIIFSLVHFLAIKTRKLSRKVQGTILSTGGGVAISYVFVELLPKLARSEPILQNAFFPYFERHVYVLALIGFMLFYLVDQSREIFHPKGRFWFSLSSYTLFNFFVGYAVGDKDNPDVQPLILFTIAMALHYFVNDYTLSKEHPNSYGKEGRWVLIASLFLGWLVSKVWILHPAASALVTAFVGGGVIMNVTRHELPKTNPHSLKAFVTACLFYTVLLLCIGSR